MGGIISTVRKRINLTEVKIMRSVAPMKTAKIGYIVLSVALCVLGIILIAFPEFSASLFGILCGVVLIMFGGVKLVGYFSKDLYRLAFQYDLVFGILMIALGVGMLTHPEGLMHFVCVALGITILADGLTKIQISRESRSFGIGRWQVMLVLAILTGVCGLALVVCPGYGGRVLMVLLGITLLLEGILNLITVIMAVKIIKDQKPDSYEADFREI